MWMPSQRSQARNPPVCPNGPSHGMLVTPGQPADHRDVAPVAEPERLDRLARPAGRGSRRRRTCRPGSRPGRRPGTGRSGFHGWIAASPITKISGWPGMVRSGLDLDPAGLVGLGAGRGGDLRANDDAWTPAAQSTVRAGFAPAAPPPRPARTDTSCSAMSVTRVAVRTVTPSRSSWRCADADRSGG